MNREIIDEQVDDDDDEQLARRPGWEERRLAERRSANTAQSSDEALCHGFHHDGRPTVSSTGKEDPLLAALQKHHDVRKVVTVVLPQPRRRIWTDNR